MSRVETIGNATLYLGDCREILPTLPKVDAVITDPPYLNLKGGYDLNWSGNVAPSINSRKTLGDEWNAELSWIKNINAIGVCIFCTHHGITEIGNSFEEYRKVALLTWWKRNSPPTGKNVPSFNSEFIWCFAKDIGIKWDRLKTTVFDIPKLQTGCFLSDERELNNNMQAAHPTQKPVQLMENLVSLCDGLVLDPFMGSGTTGVACMNLGRKFIGVEISSVYFDIACRRIEDVQRQARLFPEDKEITQMPKVQKGIF